MGEARGHGSVNLVSVQSRWLPACCEVMIGWGADCQPAIVTSLSPSPWWILFLPTCMSSLGSLMDSLAEETSTC